MQRVQDGRREQQQPSEQAPRPQRTVLASRQALPLPPPEPWGWQGGHSLALGLLTRRPHEGEEGNLIPLFVNLRKPNKLSFLQARPIFALDIWKTLPDFPISDDGPQLTWDWVPWPLRNVTSDGQRDS